MIRIRSKTEGFRRCGVAHPATWMEYEDDRFSPKELEILKAESMLQVQTGEAAEAGKSGGEPAGYSNKKLAAILTRMGVDIPKGAKKTDLEALIDSALAEPAPAKPAEDDKEAIIPLVRNAAGNLGIPVTADAGGKG